MDTDFISTVVGFIVVVAGGYYAFKGVQSNSVKTNQKDLIDVLLKAKEEQREEIKEMQFKVSSSESKIANLEGQVKTLRTIPLGTIGEEMQELKEGQNKLVEATNAILEIILEIIKANNTPRTEP